MRLTRKRDDQSRVKHAHKLLDTLKIDDKAFPELRCYAAAKEFEEFFEKFYHNYCLVYGHQNRKRVLTERRDKKMKQMVYYVQHHLRNVEMKQLREGDESNWPFNEYDIRKGDERPRSHLSGMWFIIAEDTLKADDLVRAQGHQPILEVTGDDIRAKMAEAKEAVRKYNDLGFEKLMAQSELRKLREILDRRFDMMRMILRIKLQDLNLTKAQIRNHLRRYGYVYVGKDGKPVEEPETIDQVLTEETTGDVSDPEPQEVESEQEKKQGPPQLTLDQLKSDVEAIYAIWMQNPSPTSPVWHFQSREGTSLFTVDGESLVLMSQETFKRYPMRQISETGFWVANREFRFEEDRLAIYLGNRLLLKPRRLTGSALFQSAQSEGDEA